MRLAARVCQFSRRTEEAYVGWVRRYVHYHGRRHPRELGGADVSSFLTDRASTHRVSAATQRQTGSALVFLYRDVMRIELDVAPGILRPRGAQRLPVVLTRAEAAAVLGELGGTHRLVASLLYGSGLRLLEALQLRVKDIELSRREILVRDGKGRKDRVVPLPEVSLAPPGSSCG